MDTFICKIVDVNKIPSPDGRYQAIVFTKDCGGGASAFTPYVSIFKPGEKLHNYQVGNVFIGGSGEYFVKAKWITDNHLVIWYKIGKDSLNRDILPTLMVTHKYDTLIEYMTCQTPLAPNKCVHSAALLRK